MSTKPSPHISQSTIDELADLRRYDNGWRKFIPPTCDVLGCRQAPTWVRHGATGSDYLRRRCDEHIKEE